MALADFDRQWCTYVLAELMKWGLTQPFRIPVDPVRDGAANYRDVVKAPMDLSTIKRKLADGHYRSAHAFAADVLLMCDNAILFNGDASMFGLIAADIKRWMEQQLREKPASHEDEWQRKLESVIARLHDHIARAPAGAMRGEK
jgi:bromodomain-containing factor 1